MVVQMVSTKTWVGVRSDPVRLLVWPVATRVAPVVRRAWVRVPPLRLVVAWVVFAVVLALALPAVGGAARGLDPAAAASALWADLLGSLPQVTEVLAVWALVYWRGYRRGASAGAKQAAAHAVQCSPPSQYSPPAHTP